MGYFDRKDIPRILKILCEGSKLKSSFCLVPAYKIMEITQRPALMKAKEADKKLHKG
jgi:hypothetical protein